ncbi:MAG: Na+/proline symporter/signal transduction histidine kinase/CheY-like chemotaxis protein [Oceanospirillaceae bacterium]|jgi:Na+/proline symporter/signal transduction histidine kinase/CheY-like chemotaxis protein
MFSNWLLVSVSLGYISLLFLLAHLGGKYRHSIGANNHRIIYALSLGVYCTSWGFLGTAAQAANGSFTYISLYLGPVLLFVFGWGFIQRIIKISLKLNITSIADLLSARFGKSQKLAIIITLVALIGTMPYIALQLKAIVYSYQILQENQDLPAWQLGLIVSLILTGFTILFGVRTIDISERHPGVMIAIAFESLVKLIAFIMVGMFVCFYIYDSPQQIFQLSMQHIDIAAQFHPSNLVGMVGMLVISTAAFLCLPRQFQVMFVEIKEAKYANLSRWLVPLYVIIFAFFAGPIGLAGYLLYGNSLSADAYALFLPSYDGQLWLSLFAFIGAVSAASSMVIVSTIALSTMLSNEIVFPLMFKYSRKQHHDFNHFQAQLLVIRKALVFFVIALSFSLLLLSPPDTLSSLGEVAFGAIAQIGPILVAAFYWRRATLNGVLSGVCVGFSIWLVFNFLPQLGLYKHSLQDSIYPGTTVITLIGLGFNIVVMWVVSVSSRQSLREQMQSKFFYPQRETLQWNFPKQPKVDIHELEFLVARFMGTEKAELSFKKFTNENQNLKARDFDEAVIFHAETTLAAVLGSASAKLVTSFAVEGNEMAFDQVAQLVQESSNQQLEFSRTVLQSAIENASEGISVIDSELKLVAWNQRYLDIFHFPEEFIYIGSPISQLIHYNLSQRPKYAANINEQVQKRLQFIRDGSRHSSERKLDNGITIHIEGNPIPGGGFVMIFSDITTYRQTEEHLKEENDDLEGRVLTRTAELEQANYELEQANKELALARHKAEQAHFKKSQYLKACSHDLLQPLSAARLFSSAVSLSSRVTSQERKQIKQIDNSLEIANNLLLDLNEIARIESGNITPVVKSFSIKQLFDMLSLEFKPLTKQYDINFKCHYSALYIKSDLTLLTRIIQNFLSNAFRYTNSGKVVLGCRRQGKHLCIQIYDTGPGIPKEQQQQVFEQFTQLDTKTTGPKGLGLGLNIAQSLACLLNHSIDLKSTIDKGSMFSIRVPIAPKQLIIPSLAPIAVSTLQGVKVLCIDNEENILLGMQDLLTAWKCEVYTAQSAELALQLFAQHDNQFDFLLVDYQLQDNALFNSQASSPATDGISLIKLLQAKSQYPIPAILITATTDENVVTRTGQAGIGYLRKIVKPIALRALMSSLLAKNLEKNYAHQDFS